MSTSALASHPVTLSGPATLDEATELRDRLLAALATRKNLRIDLETTGPWDLAGLQLLIATATAGRRTGQAVRLANVPKGCAEIAHRAGLSEWLHSTADSFM